VRERGEARGAQHLRARCERQRARGRDADAHAGERAGPQVARDPREVARAHTRAAERALDERREAPRMPVAHLLFHDVRPRRSFGAQHGDADPIGGGLERDPRS
jgi:hypothetical protein